MSFIQILAIGFVLGIIVSGLSFLAVLARYKYEHLRAMTSNDMIARRLSKSEKTRLTVQKNLDDACAENEFLQAEVERLRNEKLDAWDIPGSL